LQSGEIQPIGASSPVKVNVRVIAATNCDLARQVTDGHFRKDLFFRLNTFTLNLPPLRERPRDILDLAQHFARFYSKQFNLPMPDFTQQEKEWLMKYNWPGNVRELESRIKRKILLEETPQELFENPGIDLEAGRQRTSDVWPKWRQLSKEQKQQLLENTLNATGGNITHTAQRLGISRRAVQNLCHKITGK
jgi:DNA-binding NtrC family response regulator